MERGGDISNVLDKESLSNSDFLKLQFCSEGMMIRGGRPFVGDDGGAGPSGGGDGGANFNIFPSYRPQGGGGGGGGMMGFPFTADQLKELQKQALIYKYMLSSVPVPIHLLPRTFPVVDSSIYSGRYSKNGDPEPGRCKRTDGKKWRCSKEVAPHQKYCDRHLHRGRPRSRKPVEPKENHKKKPQPQPLPTPPNDLLNAKTDLTISTPPPPPPPPYYNINREGKIVASEQPCPCPWESMMKSNCYVPQQYVEEQQPLDAFCYPNLNDGDLLSLSMAGNVVDRDWVWGPLGEALGGSRPASPYNSMSTPATSPSGVLHWTLLSHSDSSVCSSPTFVAPPSEAWHN